MAEPFPNNTVAMARPSGCFFFQLRDEPDTPGLVRPCGLRECPSRQFSVLLFDEPDTPGPARPWSLRVCISRQFSILLFDGLVHIESFTILPTGSISNVAPYTRYILDLRSDRLHLLHCIICILFCILWQTIINVLRPLILTLI